MKRTIGLAAAAIAISSALTLSLAHAQSSAVDTAVTTTATTETPVTSRPQRGPGDHLQKTADLLGMSASDLKTALDSGKEFYQIAVEHGLTYSKLQAKQQAEVETRLQDMVKVGYLTQEQADSFLTKWKERAADGLIMGFGGSGFHGPRM